MEYFVGFSYRSSFYFIYIFLYREAEEITLR